MKLNLNRKSGIIMLLIAGVTIVATAQQAGHKPEHKMTNLQVLPKNISYDSVDAIMDHFKVSLGVKCGFCHARNEQTGKMDFASEGNKNKEIARAMMRMTHDLNYNYFNYMKSDRPDTIKAVTCYTCHRGHEDPVSMAPMEEEKKH